MVAVSGGSVVVFRPRVNRKKGWGWRFLLGWFGNSRVSWKEEEIARCFCVC